MHKIALVTPVKNEISNIERLINSLSKQSTKINSWIIIENDSDDGSAEYLSNIKSLKNVENLYVIKLSFKYKSYQLGIKYSTIIKYGFDYLMKLDCYESIDYVGILDSDCFPEERYYEKLISFMERESSIGISSGIMMLNSNQKSFSNSNHVRGSGRLWKKKCFEEAGYYIGMSADSISRIKAIMIGWQVKVCPDCVFYSREANSRVNLDYAGKSAYYNGFTVTYVFLKTVLYIFRRPKHGVKYFAGYFKSMFKRLPKNTDLAVINYNKTIIQRKIKKAVRIMFILF
jgi:glycosyltransferase involved in cell wall biosynthesis